jgi:putative colanic acid biosynthesis acetyltransferase WcaF
MRLDLFDKSSLERGRPVWCEALWLLGQALFVSSWIPGSVHRVWLLRAFGARIGTGVVIKPRARVKFPWRLTLGNNVWIGEGVWIDNLANVSIGDHCCISQGAYLCTGNHDWDSPSFKLVVGAITVGDQVWICARAVVGPGVSVGTGSVLTMGGVAVEDLKPWRVYGGVPARELKRRLGSPVAD